MAWYDTGTVNVTNGSTTVVGVGTNFIAGAQVGEGFYGPDNRLYEIQAIVSATALTLADVYLGTTQTGQGYKIVPTQSLVAALATQVSTLISDFQGVVDEAGSGKFADGTAASAGITFTLDQDTGIFRPAANQIGFTTAGVQRAKITNTGIDVTGTVTADGLTVAGASKLTGLAISDAGTAQTGKYFHIIPNDTETNNQFVGARVSRGNSLKDAQYSVWSQSGGAATITSTVTTGGVGGGVKLSSSANGSTAKNLALFNSNNDISFYEDTGTTPKFFWDASAESLELTNSEISSALKITKGNVSGNALEIINSGESRSIDINHNADGTGIVDDIVRIKNNGTSKFVINASGSVGIGTAATIDGNTQVQINHSGSKVYALRVGDETTAASTTGLLMRSTTEGRIYTAGGAITFGTTGGGERTRIDASGNLLVGTTDSTPYNNSGTGNGGSALHADGLFSAARDGNAVGIFNRLSSDGDIVELRKDGTTVGSIGVKDLGGGMGPRLYLGNTDTGLFFQGETNNAITPCQGDSGVTKDNSLDLGSSSARFKDLYLSGGVVFGTGGPSPITSNTLDDYEEGTWTPDLRFDGGSTGITYASTPQGEYTKIGNMVVARGEIRLSSKGSSTGSLLIYGLPFTPSIVVDWEGGFVTNWANLRGIYSVPVSNISNGVTYCSWRSASGGVVTGAEFNDPSMTNANIDDNFILGFTLNYRTA